MPIEKPKIYKSEELVPKDTRKVDTMQSSLRELFFIENPTIHKSTPGIDGSVKKFIEENEKFAVWVYYPWLATAVHIPDEKRYYQLRTARNRDLITNEEQARYREAVVGIAGLSVGSAVFATLVATGGPRRMKIADPDTLELTNLNRIRATLVDTGENKTIIAARHAWEIDPFLELETVPEGLTDATLENFAISEPRLTVFIDEMDALPLKIQSRIICQKHRIPVIMATDNGDSIIVDIERFDLEPERPIFHGRIHLSPEELKTVDRSQFVKISNEIIDPAYFTLRQQQSILLVGKELDSIPRIGTAAAISGAALAFVVRQIAIGAPMPSGRYVMSCEQTFIPEYSSQTEQEKRAAHTQKFVNAFKRP